MEEFSEEEIVTQQLVIVLSATHGEGDPPDNAMRFHKWIKTKVKEKSNALEKMKFSCFGLGNTQYENYNAMGRFFNKGFSDLGAKLLYKYGEGDDDVALEKDFIEWKKDLWKGLADHYTALGGGRTLTKKRSVSEEGPVFPLDVHIIPAQDALAEEEKLPNNNEVSYDLTSR